MMRSAFQVVVSQHSLYSTGGMKLTVILLHEYVRPCMVPFVKLADDDPPHLGSDSCPPGDTVSTTGVLPMHTLQYNTHVTRFIWGPQEILAGEGPAVREARVWRHAVVQVGTQ